MAVQKNIVYINVCYNLQKVRENSFMRSNPSECVSDKAGNVYKGKSVKLTLTADVIYLLFPFATDSLASPFSLIQYLRVKPELTRVEHLSEAPLWT